MRHTRFLLIFLSVIFTTCFLPSCEILQQASEISRLKNCDFEFEGLDSVTLAGVRFSNEFNPLQMTSTQMLQLTSAVMKKNLPADFQVLFTVKNPNAKAAALTKMDYIVMFDGVELLNGSTGQALRIPPNGQAILRVPLHTEVFKALSGQASVSVNRLVNKITGVNNEPLELLVKVKPYLNAGGQSMAYPGFLEYSKKL